MSAEQIAKSNQRWLTEHEESFLDYQRRTDQITAEIFHLTYEQYLDRMSHETKSQG